MCHRIVVKFIVCFLTLYCSVGGFFILLLAAWKSSRNDDGFLWAYFVLQMCFATLLFVGIITLKPQGVVIKSQDVEDGGSAGESKQ